ncbi:transposase [Snodgrassella alvi]|uniref:transposase n=1 Tax=Snodgrassella alvi TaxID=1196083 RepID=UPI00117ADE40
MSVLTSTDMFESANQFGVYLGLNPRKMESGKPLKGRRHISKVGKSEYRTALYMPAILAYSKIYILILYLGLQNSGKTSKIIIMALIRKLAIYAYTVYKTN